MKFWIGSFGKAISWILFRAPNGLRRGLGAALGFVWFDVLRIRRQVALENVARAFPEMNERDRLRIARVSLRHIGINFIEYAMFPWLTKANVHDYVEFVNERILDEALARGRGVLLLTLHMGNGDLGCTALAVAGYPMVMVSKLFKFKWLNELWFGMRERAGVKFISPRNSSFGLLKALKSNQVVVIPFDQFTGPPIGLRSIFFGHETGTGAGLATMAERSKAQVISVFGWRKPDGRHVVEFAREMAADDAPIEVVTQRFNDELERIVRLHPEQWMWIHRRWKTFRE